MNENEIKTTTMNGYLDTAENDTFAWRSFQPDYLTHKPTGRQIYQMDWYEWGNSHPIDDQAIITAVNEFRAAVKVAQVAPKRERIAVSPVIHGDGWCDKCQSYCYGDCGR